MVRYRHAGHNEFESVGADQIHSDSKAVDYTIHRVGGEIVVDGPDGEVTSGTDIGAVLNSTFSSVGEETTIGIKKGTYQYSTTPVQNIRAMEVVGLGPHTTRPDEGLEGVVLDYQPTDGSNAYEIVNVQNQSLRGVTITCDKAGGHTGNGILIDGATNSPRQLENTTVYQAGGAGVLAIDNWVGKFRGCYFMDCAVGVSANNMNEGRITDSTMTQCNVGVVTGDDDSGSFGSGPSQITIENNEIANNGIGVFLSRKQNSAESTVTTYAPSIRENHFEGNTTADVSLGWDGSGQVVNDPTVKGNFFNSTGAVSVRIGRSVPNYEIGPNRHHDYSDQFSLYAGSGNTDGVIHGVNGSALSISNGNDFWWGQTHTVILQNDGEVKKKGAGTDTTPGPFTDEFSRLKNVGTYSGSAPDLNADLNGHGITAISQGSATTIDTISGGVDGATVTFKFDDGNTTLAHGTGNLYLAGGTDFTPSAGDTIELTYIGADSTWFETSRSA